MLGKLKHNKCYSHCW